MKNPYTKLLILLLCLVGCVPLWAQTYPLNETDLAAKIAAKQQITDVPTMYIQLPEAYANQDHTGNTTHTEGCFTKDDGYQTATVQLVDNSNTLENFTDANVQVKIRGNSTASYAKKPYRLKFAKDVKDASGNVTQSYKRDLLGMGYKKRNWVLMANYCDGSLIRNAVMYHIGKYLNLGFVPGYKYIDLVVNGSYRGTYQVSDQVETGSNRVDIDEDNDWMLEFVNGAQVDTDQGISAGTYDGVSVSINTNVKNPEVTAGTFASSQLRKDVISYVNEWYKAFESPSSATGWQHYNDLDNLARFYVAINLTGDWDGFMIVKAWRELGSDKLHWGPLWDKDLAFGNYTSASAESLVEDYQNDGQLRYKLVALQSDVTFLTKVKAIMDELAANDNLKNKLTADIDNLAKLLDNTQKQNFKKWEYNGDKGLGNLKYTNYADYITQLKTWLVARITKVKELIDAKYNAKVTSVATTSYDVSLSYNYTSLWNLYNTVQNLTLTNTDKVTSTAWSTLIFPFSATEAQMKSALGNNDYDLMELDEITEDGTFKFKSATSKDITDSTPYLIKLKSGESSTSWTFSNVVPVTSSDQAVTIASNGNNKLTAIWHGASNLNSYYYDGKNLTADGAALTQFTYPNTSLSGMHFYFETASGTMPKIALSGSAEEPTDPNEHKRQTSLPTLYINGTLNTTGDWSTATVEVFDADVPVLGGTKTYVDLEAKYKGTYKGGEKHGYRFKFKKKEKLNGYRQWELLPLDNDPTLLREALALETGKQLGMAWTPSYQFVDVCLSNSTTDAYTYVGTYLLVDRVKVEEGRALVTGGNSDNDWLVQLADNFDTGDLYVEATAQSPYVLIKNPDPDDYVGQEETLKSGFNWFTTDFFTNTATLSDNLNKEQFIEWYIAQEVLCAYKGLSEVYAYRSLSATDKTVYFGPLADNGRAFGNYKKDKKKQVLDMSDKDKTGSYDGLMVEYADYAVMRHLLKNLWLQDWFASGVQTKWNSISSSLETTLKDKVTSLATAIQASREKNYASDGAKWQLAPLSADYQLSVDSITTYLTDRFDYLDAKFKELAKSKTLVYNTKKDDAMNTWLLSNAQSVKVQLKNRGTIHGNEWNMLTLPFALDANGIQTVFGSGAQVKEFTSVEETANNVGLYFTAVNAMEAGKPYIVKPTADVNESQLTFNNVAFSSNAAQPVTQGSYTLNGTLVKTTLTPTDANDKTIKYLGTGEQKNTLLYLTQAADINGCRAYFKVSDNQSAAKAVTFIDSETTEILTVEGFDTVEGQRVYNLNGQLLGTSLQALPRGIYIVGGKKVTK